MSPATQLFPAICPKAVRYIKLGEGGGWENECREKGIVRYGFGTSSAERFPLCRAGRWGELTKSFIAEGKNKGTATRFTNETRLFFEDDGSTLWITFIADRLCWGFLAPSPPERHASGHGVWRAVADGWRWTDRNGEQLTKDRLSGALTKMAAYRGTSCSVDARDYVVRRINAEKSPEVKRALVGLEEMKQSALAMVTMLGPQDFELLVDLVFSTSGWRRLGPVGKTQKTLDLALMLPSTGERAFVQVKSKTTRAELIEYERALADDSPYDRMFYVFHSGDAKTANRRVTVWGPEEIAQLVVNAGLVGWLVDKVS
jgi:hypothetical protein